MKQDIQWGLRKARRNGQRVVEPRANELQIDIDGARALRRYGMQWTILERAGITKGWREHITSSKRAGHVHVTIVMPRSLPALQRVGLQAILGSDLMREAFNWSRVVRKNKYPIAFFEKEQHGTTPRTDTNRNQRASAARKLRKRRT